MIFDDIQRDKQLQKEIYVYLEPFNYDVNHAQLIINATFPFFIKSVMTSPMEELKVHT